MTFSRRNLGIAAVAVTMCMAWVHIVRELVSLSPVVVGTVYRESAPPGMHHFYPLLDSIDTILEGTARLAAPREIGPPLPNPLHNPRRVSGRFAEGGRGSYTREKLVLRGIVLHGARFAIILDSQGKSIICKPGESIGQQRIVDINRNGALIRDALGSYLLEQ